MSQNLDVNHGLPGLAALLQKPTLNSIWYNNKEVKLDGYKFSGCRFDNCTLILTSSNFELENCFIDESTRVQFGGQIVNAIKLFNSRSDWAYSNMPFFAPVKNVDGTITIKD